MCATQIANYGLRDAVVAVRSPRLRVISSQAVEPALDQLQVYYRADVTTEYVRSASRQLVISMTSLIDMTYHAVQTTGAQIDYLA